MATPKNTPTARATEDIEATSVRIDALMDQITAQRRQAARRQASRSLEQILRQQEKSLPADVPLHKRGCGVMEKD
jgi:hypothetical protein